MGQPATSTSIKYFCDHVDQQIVAKSASNGTTFMAMKSNFENDVSFSNKICRNVT